MTPSQINLGMLLLIAINIVLIVLAVPHLKKWWVWLVPIGILLLFGAIYSVVYIVDATDKINNPMLYNGMNNFLRAQSYLTIAMYAAAFLVMVRRKGINKNG